VYVWSPEYIWVVYAARVHVQAAYTRIRLFSWLRSIRDCVCVYYCRTYYEAVCAGGEGDSEGHVL
jgi:hypothetical protein